MPELEPITREEMFLDGQDLEPITREEMFIKRIYDKTQFIPEPITRHEMFLKKAGEGGSDVDIVQLNVTENGTYSEQGKAYSPVIVDVSAPLPENAYLIKDAEAPADIVTFDDGQALPMPTLKIGINAVQSGSGDPYPAGGGKNKLPLLLSSIKAQNPNGWSGNTQTIGNVTLVYETIGDSITAIKATANSGANLTISLEFSLPSGSYILSSDFEETVYQYDTLLSTSSTTIARGNSTSPGQSFSLAETTTVTWNLRIIKTGTATIKPMIRLASVSDPTFAPYSNIRPISGFTEGNVSVSGTNVWDEEWELGYWGNGFKRESSSNIRSTNKIPIVPNTTYYLLIPSNFYYTYYDADGEVLPQSGYDSQSRFVKTTSGTVTTPSGAYYMTFNMGSVYGTTYNNDISINYPSTDTDYHTYNGHTTTISWEDEVGTVYGGTLDVVSGVLTVDRAYVDMGTLDWNKANNMFNKQLPNGKEYDMTEVANMMCSNYPIVSYDDRAEKTICAYSDNIYVKDSDYETIEEFKTAMSGVQLVYELATPTTYQLSPTAVKSLLGDNNVWADTNGEILECQYWSKEA